MRDRVFITIHSLAIFASVVLIAGYGVGADAIAADQKRIVEVYLTNQLDEERGFCLDIKGHKTRAKIERGLQAHTCYSYQGSISVDQGFDATELTKNKFFLPAFDICMEAAFRNGQANLRLSPCRNEKLQEFKFQFAGTITPAGNRELCLTVAGGKSRKGGGGSPVHLMRNLSLQPCGVSLSNFQRWATRDTD
ncbi:MAG: hypothetical protein CFH41_01395 [Alphaproteobacteria bacterium MarineAlpha11_Bin1]|nr:MAG: hypothetical protein CFH41_01395 [Alphaproteobacteria bacterium MarineAlpha11_Bin1]|tara:strand:- start:7709 stop:8287 length:579 start_codon:yes stop_codon:yes gene_type:complete